MCHQPGNRPDAHDIVRDLGFYFRDHDLDQPVITAASSVDELTEDFTAALDDVGNREDDDDHGRARALLQPITSGGPSKHSHLRPASSVSLPYDHKHPMRLGPSKISSAASTYVPQGEAIPRVHDTNNGIARSGYRKSIRRIVEELESKRLSHPEKIRRRTFWDFKMEELPGLPGPPLPPDSDEDSS